MHPLLRTALSPLAAALIAVPLGAQSALSPMPARSVAVFSVALYTAGANKQEATDTAWATLGSRVLREKLTELLGPAIIDSGAVDSLGRSAKYRAIAGDQFCNVIVACVRAVGKDLGAAWVVMAKVSKTSNLIWLLTSQLIYVPTGEIVMDDSTELKGDPEPMVRAGVRIFAERVARTIRERNSGARASGS